MATGVVSWSTTAASNATADSTVNFAEGMAPSAVNDSARALMASVAKWRDDLNGSLTTAGTSTAYTLTTNQSFASLAALANQELAFTVHTTSGATPTLAVDGLTAKPIRLATGSTLPTGALVADSVFHVTYNNTSGEFLVRNQTSSFSSATFGGAVTITTGGLTVTAGGATITAGGLTLSADTIVVPTGSASAPTYSFASDSNSGIYRIGADNIGVTVAGSKVLDISATGLAVTGTVTGTAVTATNVAAQSDQETGTSTTTFVSPGRQQYHASSPKAWAQFNPSATVTSSYNVSSVTDSGSGAWAPVFTTAFSSNAYSFQAIVGQSVALSAGSNPSNGRTSTTAPVLSINTSGTATDTNGFIDFVALGDQA